MNTKIDKKLHLSLLNIIETVDKNEEQLKELIKKSIFADANIPENEKDNVVIMYTAQILEMRRNLTDKQEHVEKNSINGIIFR